MVWLSCRGKNVKNFQEGFLLVPIFLMYIPISFHLSSFFPFSLFTQRAVRAGVLRTRERNSIYLGAWVKVKKEMIGDAAQWVQCLPWKCDGLSLNPQNPHKNRTSSLPACIPALPWRTAEALRLSLLPDVSRQPLQSCSTLSLDTGLCRHVNEDGQHYRPQWGAGGWGPQ